MVLVLLPAREEPQKQPETNGAVSMKQKGKWGGYLAGALSLLMTPTSVFELRTHLSAHNPQFPWWAYMVFKASPTAPNSCLSLPLLPQILAPL